MQTVFSFLLLEILRMTMVMDYLGNLEEFGFAYSSFSTNIRYRLINCRDEYPFKNFLSLLFVRPLQINLGSQKLRNLVPQSFSIIEDTALT